MAEVESRTEKRAAGATTTESATIKGKIVEFTWHLKKEGYQESTIQRYVQGLKTLLSKNAELFDPENVKEIIAKQPWQESTKLNYIHFYSTFATFLGLRWQKPRYQTSRRLPFIPLESEIDLLIHGTGKKLSTTLQIIKETGMRIGEVLRLKWIDVDPERNTITINNPEKHGKSGMFKVSTQLIQRTLILPKKSDYIFRTSRNAITCHFSKVRKRLAKEYNNPRLLRISFHTIRHWKATTEYHKTKDILHVKEMLRHQSLDNTLIYIHLEKALYGEPNNQEFHVRVAHSLEEACEFVKAGFDYVCEMEGSKIFRKRE